MWYGVGETPIEPGPDGRVKIHRTPEEVFRKETIASANAKPLTDEHPDNESREVNPDNWNDLAMGVVFDARRGEGVEDDLLLASILVTNRDAIEEVLSGKRELSCGYEADYIQTAPGEGFQRNILINHVALVESGRCGARCAIGDRDPGGANKMKWIDKLTKELKAKLGITDEAKLKEVLSTIPEKALTFDDDEGEGTESGTHMHVHVGGGSGEGGSRSKWTDEKLDEEFGKTNKMVTDNHSAVMKALDDLGKKFSGDAETNEKDKEIEGELKEEAPGGTGDDDRKPTRDSKFLAEVFQDTISLAEIIAPGIHVPTFDAASKARDTYASICGLRKRALGFGLNEPATNAMILKANGGREVTVDSLNQMRCPAAKVLFNAVAAMKKEANNSVRTETSTARTGDKDARVRSIADINKRNTEAWARK
jgi:uncharacterized protein